MLWVMLEKTSLFRESLVWHKLMEIYENPACYEQTRDVYEVGVGGSGDGRQKTEREREREREGRSRSPKTSNQLSFRKR